MAAPADPLERPSMELVSSNSDKEIRAQRARDDAEWAMVDLTVNLLRIVRGNGKPHELGRQMNACLDAMQAAWDAERRWPFSEMATAARLPGLYDRKTGDDFEIDVAYARQQVLQGALQYIASDLANQRAQQASGERELMRGIEMMRAAFDERDQALRRAATRGAAAGRAHAAKSRSPKRKPG